MTNVLRTPPSNLTYLTSQPVLPVAAQMAISVAVLVTKWSARKRSRRALAELSPEQLRDIGVTAKEAHIEASLPFWKP
ncbi:hypothetical protein TRM7557_03782 [Tritonibacter multivorans]|uniref:YjiS-like domain-containing protein n=1 Tax=Tritonibacter multivorans TaxID=928856 RepID=A0A0P1GJK9_9RHOB|nr:DUF1127 domain-containing protein [Tritonibacter multivorans]MDA7421571.1 DUF1127 domain-containing protein [Tritonibacter multivorans]CUH82150.1 hypothetical protein TRM7557_03782 [Tritonibacter multivorans]SFC95299.1 Uncharacterized conserved protein YjiS, DUF1127 family [Tritonibacter multivorans]